MDECKSLQVSPRFNIDMFFLFSDYSNSSRSVGMFSLYSKWSEETQAARKSQGDYNINCSLHIPTCALFHPIFGHSQNHTAKQM